MQGRSVVIVNLHLFVHFEKFTCNCRHCLHVVLYLLENIQVVLLSFDIVDI